MPSILITRPDSAGSRFAERLRAALDSDVNMVLSPLMRIEPCGELPDLTAIETLIFTSRNGLEAFARISDQREIPCYTVGDATANVARSIGMIATSCGGDADALVVQMLAHGVPGPCLHIRGEHGVGDIAARLTAMGVQTNEAVLYRQMAEPLNAAAMALLQGQKSIVIPLFCPDLRAYCAKA